MPLAQTLAALRTRLQAAKDAVGASAGPLVDPQRTTVQDNLDAALDDIATSLQEINDEGAADETLPGTLPDIADLCVDLADDAVQQLEGQTQDNQQIGNDIKTINYLIEVKLGYRNRVVG